MRNFIGLLLCLMSFSVNASDKPYYTVGVVPQFSPQEIARIWQPILNYISQQLGVEFRLLASPSIPKFEKSFSQGEFDFAYMNPYHLVVAHRVQGYQPLLKDVNKKLRGIIVVNQNSPINSVKELAGKTVAFPAPNALGAALIPRAEFSRKFKIQVKELYANSHSSVYLNVVMGVADAGGGVEKSLAKQPENIRKHLRVLYKTDAVAAHPIASHPRVEESTRERFKKSFLQLSESETGRALIAKIPINRLGEASLEEYQSIEKLGLDDFYIGAP